MMSRITFRSVIIQSAAMFLSVLTASAPMYGQSDGERSVQLQVFAFRGEPFSVARIEVPPHAGAYSRPHQPGELFPIGKGAFYPVVEKTGPLTDDSGRSSSYRVLMLFDASESPKFNICNQSVTLTAVDDHDRFLQEFSVWWTAWERQAVANMRTDRYPRQLDQYLLSMLSRRLNRSRSLPDPVNSFLDADSERMIGYMTGTEAVRVALQKDRLLDVGSDEHAELPLPTAAVPPPIQVPQPAADVVIEGIAKAVPIDSFYIRLPRYEDLEWFTSLAEIWGTELNAFGSLRGLNFQTKQRLQNRLNLHLSEIARQLSSAVVQEFAIVGDDPFVREGAGLGVLFHASADAALRMFLTSQRQKCAAEHPEVSLTELRLEGFDDSISLLSSADHRVRSFYVTRGSFHLVTSSQYLVRRFLETCAQPETSLGASQEFRYARTVMPLQRNDQAFVYLSDHFFRRFLDPAFRIEMTRRAISDADCELVELARLAAASESKPCGTIEDLIAGGFLPPKFLHRVDGSRLSISNGIVIDSVRGVRGSFVPVADVPVDRVTATEAEEYAKFSEQYRRIWQWLDPAAAGLHRHLDNDTERLVMDLHVYPYPRREFAFLEMIAPQRLAKRVAPIPGVIAFAEANIFGVTPAMVGIADVELPVIIENGNVMADDVEGLAPLFWGGANIQRILGSSRFNQLPDRQIQDHGASSSAFDRFAMRDSLWGFLGNTRAALQPLVGQVQITDAERSAEFRLHVGDISQAKLAPHIHAQIWAQGCRIALGQAEFLNRLVTQLNIESDTAVQVSHRVLNAELTHPLGGRFDANRLFTASRPSVLEYRSPFVSRFRGAEFELTTEGTTLIGHSELRLSLPTR